MAKIEVDWYQTWEGVMRVTLDNGSKGYSLTRDEARALRDELTLVLEAITQDEEHES